MRTQRNPPSKRHLVPWFREAFHDRLFRERWLDRRDTGFRPFAVAVFELLPVETLETASRQALYRRAATARRRDLLAHAAGRPVPRATMKLIERASWRQFARSDWGSLMASATDPEVAGALGALDRISPDLVRQLDLIPKEFLQASVLRVLDDIGEVPAARWKRLSRKLCDDTPDRAAAKVLAERIRTAGDFWDACFHVTLGYPLGRIDDLPFPLAETLRPWCRSLEPMSSVRQLEVEGSRMSNCLARLAPRALRGESVYFRHRHEPAVTAELVRTPHGWQPGRILGQRNEPIDTALESRIGAELRELVPRIPGPNERPRNDRCIDFLRDLRRESRRLFEGTTIDRIAQPLRAIRGRSRNPTDGAFVIASIDNGDFIQFLSSLDGTEYLCEVLSHKFQPHVSALLDACTVDTIERAGFAWPAPGKTPQNFSRWFAVSGPQDCDGLAELALALLARVFGHRPPAPVHVKVHIPGTPDRQ